MPNRTISTILNIDLVEWCIFFLGFVSPCIIIHSNKSINHISSISQIYCSSFKYTSTCFGHSRAHHQELINCSSTAVYKLLMMGTRMPETCWAVFKRQAINLRDWCIWLVDLFECMMMHGLRNAKSQVMVTSFPIITGISFVLLW